MLFAEAEEMSRNSGLRFAPFSRGSLTKVVVVKGGCNEEEAGVALS
jgi:hypothetical protein